MWKTSAISWTTDCSEHRIGVQIIKSHFFSSLFCISPHPFYLLELWILLPRLWSAGITGDCQHIPHKQMAQLLDANTGSDTVVAASCDMSSDPHSHTPSYKHIQYPTVQQFFHLEALVCEIRLWKQKTLCRCEHTVWESERFMIRQFGKGLLLHRNIAGLHEKEAKLVGLPHFLTTCSVSSKSNFSTPHSHPWEGH